jgi:hypothetical protein
MLPLRPAEALTLRPDDSLAEALRHIRDAAQTES